MYRYAVIAPPRLEAPTPAAYLHLMTTRLLFAIALLLFSVSRGAAQTQHPDSARVITEDIQRFWKAYDRLSPASTRQDSIDAFATGYFAPASPGLENFIDRRLKKPESLLFALGMLPRYYQAVREGTLRIGSREADIRAALRRVETVYPPARYPDIYFIIAGFIAQGNVAGDNMFIAAEMVAADSTTPVAELPPFLRDVDLSAAALPCILVHELFHYQQNYARDNSLLAQSINEGVADFLTEQSIGCIPTARRTYDYGNANEAALWKEFQAAMGGTDMSRWLYNGNNSGDRPSQLGYWMGYRIARAYYEGATDKKQAVHDLLHIENFPLFLKVSHYASTLQR